MISIPIEVIRDFHEVPESMIIEAAAAHMGENNFKQLLVSANIFRKAKCEPIFLVNNDQTLMLCTCKETWGRRLH